MQFLNIKPIMSMKKNGSKLGLVGGMWGKKYNPHKFEKFVIKN